MADVNGSEREQMDFLGLVDQQPPGWLWEGAGIIAVQAGAAVDELAQPWLQPVHFLQAGFFLVCRYRLC